jgi:hypothetical protein
MATQLTREMCCPTANSVNMRVFTIATLALSVPDWRRLAGPSLNCGRLRIIRTFSGKSGPRDGVANITVTIPRAFPSDFVFFLVRR